MHDLHAQGAFWDEPEPFCDKTIGDSITKVFL